MKLHEALLISSSITNSDLKTEARFLRKNTKKSFTREELISDHWEPREVYLLINPEALKTSVETVIGKIIAEPNKAVASNMAQYLLERIGGMRG